MNNMGESDRSLLRQGVVLGIMIGASATEVSHWVLGIVLAIAALLWMWSLLHNGGPDGR